MRSLVLALQQRSPSAETDDTTYGSLFGQIADLLLNRTTLFIADHPCRITELELYFHGLRHLDPFTHNDPVQQQLGTWYFHRAGTQYRSRIPRAVHRSTSRSTRTPARHSRSTPPRGPA